MEASEAHWDNRELTSGADVLLNLSSSEFRFHGSLWNLYLGRGRPFLFIFLFLYFLYVHFNSK